jgi:hypothetical protein
MPKTRKKTATTKAPKVRIPVPKPTKVIPDPRKDEQRRLCRGKPTPEDEA